MNDLTPRLRRLAEELRRMEDDLNRIAASQEPTHHTEPGIPAGLDDLQLLTTVKTSLDSVRHLLWPYVEIAAHRSQTGVDLTLQRYRMERVTEMLENLQQRAAHPALPAMPEVHSFFEEIHEIAGKTVERHLTAK